MQQGNHVLAQQDFEEVILYHHKQRVSSRFQE